jgi:topoisomerase-4 subunit A
MQYPHGDASIGDAMVQIGQKTDWRYETGKIILTDDKAASRYIEALSKFALEVIYSPKITDWGMSYDGRREGQIIFLLNSQLFALQEGLQWDFRQSITA